MTATDRRPGGPPPRLFGTDGVRGTAGRPPLDATSVRRLGAALVRVLPAGARPRMLVGRDTRESSEWIEAELAFGAVGEGASVASVGVVPTPAVAYLTRREGFDLGVVISASHNPFQDNGIKVFSGRGEKFGEAVERHVEALMADPSWRARAGDAGPVEHVDLTGPYLGHLRDVMSAATLPADFLLAVDCANGATTTIGPTLFETLGLTAIFVGVEPDGRNINLGCGSMHPEHVARKVADRGCRMGVAFDGDGDRAIFVDEQGRTVDGDAVLLMCARQLQSEGRLRGQAIVATVMSNVGLEMALNRHGIELVRCAVGDKHVMEAMLARDLSLGGEQSGHIIFSDYLFTGDGLCTALNVLRTVALTGCSLSELAGELVTYPQVLVNVRVREKTELAAVPAVSTVVADVERKLAGRGRLLVRYSGTEPLLRVMIEGERADEIRMLADQIADVVRTELG